MTEDAERHNEKMRKHKVARDKIMATKTIEKGLLLVHTGKGKGKTTAAMGMVCRAIGHGHRVAIIQFIKGAMFTGEKVVFDAFPEQVTALILIDPAGYPIQRPALAFRLARIPILSRLLAMLDPGHMVKRTLRSAYGDPRKVTPELVAQYRDLTLREGNRAAFVARAQQSRVDDSASIARVRAPTLILWGREDRLIPVADAARFAQAIPGAKLIVYDGVGHVPMEEIGQRSVLDAEAFLSAR